MGYKLSEAKLGSIVNKMSLSKTSKESCNAITEQNGNIIYQGLETDPNDFTLVNTSFVIQDDSISGKNQRIPLDVLNEYGYTLKNKPIVCKYYPKTSENNNLDAFGGHERHWDYNRNNELIIKKDTNAIGVCENSFIAEVNTEQALVGNFKLWKDRFPDQIGLLQEWVDRGIEIYTSDEFLYWDSEIDEETGIETILAPILFVGHCILNSEDRGIYPIVQPAYSNSKLIKNNDLILNSSLNSIDEQNLTMYNKDRIIDVSNSLDSINKVNNKEKGVENELSVFRFMPEKDDKYMEALNSISCGDMKYKIYDSMKKLITADEWDRIYLSNYDIYPTDNYFIYEKWDENWSNIEYYQVPMSIGEDDVISIDMEASVKVNYGFKEVVNMNDAEKIKKLEEDNKELTNSLETIKKDLEAEKAKSVDNSKENNSKLMKTIIELTGKLEGFNSMKADYEDLKAKETKKEIINSIEEGCKTLKMEEKEVKEMVNSFSEEIEKACKDSEVKSALNSKIEKTFYGLAIEKLNKIQETNNSKPSTATETNNNLLDDVKKEGEKEVDNSKEDDNSLDISKWM